MARFRQEVKLSPQEVQEKIRKVAYGLYHKRGCQHGKDWQDWLEAEKLVKNGKA